MGRRRQRSDPESEFDSTESPGWVDGGWRLIQGLISQKLSRTPSQSLIQLTVSAAHLAAGLMVGWLEVDSRVDSVKVIKSYH